jgi:elongation factor P
VANAVVGEAASYLLENQEVVLALNEGEPLFLEMPASVELTVDYTEPGLQGDRATGGSKPARVETGLEVSVPLFIKQGEKIKVDTRDGSYLGRAGS